MQAFLTPPPLRPGDRIQIIAPAGAVPRDAFETGVALLSAAGFVPDYDPALFERDMYFAGSHARRQAELGAALSNPEVKAVWAARGGYGTARLLGPLSAESLRAQPKWLVGFSDLTGLHAAYQSAQLISMHGANVTTLASWSVPARERLFAMLAQSPRCDAASPQGGAPSLVFVGTDASRSPQASVPLAPARLWGGNLTVLASLCGTGQLPDVQALGPSVLLLEEVGEAPYRLDRCWHQLEASGALVGVVGVAIGQLTGCEAKGADYTGLQMLTGAIEAAGLPWVSGLPFGHAPDAEAVPLGGLATLDAAHATLAIAL